MKRRDFVKAGGISAAAAFSTSVAGCIGGGGGGGTDTTTIGILSPYSGPLSSASQYIVQGTRLAVDQANENRDIGAELETVTADTASNPEDGVAAAREMINREEVDMLAGGMSSSTCLAVAPVASENELPYPSTASALTFTGPDCSPYGFTSAISVRAHANTALPYLAENRGMESIYPITADYDWGQTASEYYRQLLPELDVEIAGESFAPFGATDFSTQISSAMDSDADTVYLTLFGQDMVQGINQLEDFGGYEEFDNVVMALNDVAFDSGINRLEGIMGAAQYYWRDPNETNQEFVSAYRETFGQVPTTTSAIMYGQMNAFMAAAERVGDITDGEAIVEDLVGREIDPFFQGGTSTVRQDRQFTHDTWLLEGKPLDEREHTQDYMRIVNRFDGDEIYDSDPSSNLSSACADLP